MFSGKSDELGVQNVESNASTHEQFLREVNNRLVWATEQEDVSLTFQSEYLYGIAQAEISSLRNVTRKQKQTLRILNLIFTIFAICRWMSFTS